MELWRKICTNIYHISSAEAVMECSLHIERYTKYSQSKTTQSWQLQCTSCAVCTLVKGWSEWRSCWMIMNGKVWYGALQDCTGTLHTGECRIEWSRDICTHVIYHLLYSRYLVQNYYWALCPAGPGQLDSLGRRRDMWCVTIVTGDGIFIPPSYHRGHTLSSL